MLIIVGLFYQFIWLLMMSEVPVKSPFPTTHIYEYTDENEW